MADERYERHKGQAAERQAEQSRAGREIGEIPPPANKRRRNKAQKHFQAFLEQYFAPAFPLAWSPDHLSLIDKVQRVITKRQFVAAAYMRGFGKSTIFERALLWAALFGLSEYSFLIGATKDKAADNLDVLRLELQFNDELAADFPEVCYPIRKLEGIANRCAGQLHGGAPTRIVWKGNRLVLPTITGSAASGAVIGVGGLTGSEIRGAKFLHPTGRILRPEVVLIDDPQTRESARSALQVKDREDLITSDARGMAGPGKPISMLAAVTIVCADDVAERLTDRKRHPEWRGERHPFLRKFPDRMDLWQQYGDRLVEELENDGDGRQTTAYYKKNKKAMDAGGEVSWPERHDPEQLSGLQHAMTLFLLDPDFFWSELQNAPQPDDVGDLDDLLTPDDIAAKQHAQKRGLIPLGCEHLTAFIDCHKKLLYWTLCAFRDDFTGHVLDYGTWPEQPRSYFAMREARPTIQQKCPGAGEEAALRKSLVELTSQLNRAYPREDGTSLSIDRCLIDRGWKPDVVNQFCRESSWNAVLPASGVGLGAKKAPMSDWQKKSGEKIGPHWRLRSDAIEKIRYVLTDTNYFKSFAHARLAVSIGDAGCLSLFKAKESTHRLFAEHLRAEQRTRVEAAGRTLDEWDLPANKPDNHWFDCLVGCHVAASLLGVRLPDAAGRKRGPVKQKLSMAERRARKRQEAAA